jgi:hypothetical protein
MNGLEIMLAELEANRLEVVLVPTRHPSNEGGMIRVPISRNAFWYQRFCARHASGRQRRKAAFDTRIKRRNVAALLNRLIVGQPSRSKYAAELLRVAASCAPKLEAVA